MTFDTREMLRQITAELANVRVSVQKVQEDTQASITKIQQEFGEIIKSQREEIIRLHIELEQAHKKERRKRIAALKRFKSE